MLSIMHVYASSLNQQVLNSEKFTKSQTKNLAKVPLCDIILNIETLVGNGPGDEANGASKYS